jgi:hypothetical protein
MKTLLKPLAIAVMSIAMLIPAKAWIVDPVDSEKLTPPQCQPSEIVLYNGECTSDVQKKVERCKTFLALGAASIAPKWCGTMPGLTPGMFGRFDADEAAKIQQRYK